MTAFSIDTGPDLPAAHSVRFGRIDAMAYDILESLPENPTQSQIDGMTAQIVMGELRAAKLLVTARRRLVALWPIIAPLHLTSPASFDEILTEYAELTTQLR